MSWLVDTSVWSLDIVHPDLEGRVEAAGICNACRRRGVQNGAIDALLVQLCRRPGLVLLSADGEFRAARAHVTFGLWWPR